MPGEWTSEHRSGIDDIFLLASGFYNTTDYTYGSNNELLTMEEFVGGTDNNLTTFTYDDWGRTVTETLPDGTVKTYSWTMANMLAGVDSDDPGDTDVSYTYRGDLKRAWRWEDGNVLTNYNWGAGFNVVSEEDVGSPNTLARTYVAGLAEIIGSNPATGTPRYLTHDHLGSTRGVFDGAKASLGTFEYTPYGNPYAFTGPPDITQLFTGHDLDRLTGNYYAPFRYLNPSAGRWMKMDPIGMVDGLNIYWYARANPIRYIDPYGLEGLFDNIIDWCRSKWPFGGGDDEPEEEVPIPTAGDAAANAAGDALDGILRVPGGPVIGLALGLANGAGVVAEGTMDNLANMAGIYGGSQPEFGRMSDEDFERLTTRGFFNRN